MSSIKIEPKDRWAVWSKKGHRPFAFQRTCEGALEEAARLATLNPANKFHVVYFDVKVSAIPTETCPTCGTAGVFDEIVQVSA